MSLKKGDLAEWHEALNGSSDIAKRDALNAVIHAMTAGKDVTSLFPDVIKCIITKDLELKKLVYLYLITHAKDFPETTILAVNAFVKDSQNTESPFIRALAIRTMGCVRLPQIAEYLAEPLCSAVRDLDSYVRKTAALTIAKLFRISPQLCLDNDLIKSLMDLIQDGNQVVVANAVSAAIDIIRYVDVHARDYAGTISYDSIFTDGVVRSALAAVPEVNEWGLISLLESLVYYKPSCLEDAVAAAEKILPKLQHANTSVVISAVRAVLHLVTYMQSDQRMVVTYMKRVTPACVTLLCSDSPGIQYATLRCLPSIIQVYPTLFARDIRPLLPKYQDVLYVKLEKLELLLQLATENNAAEILSELKEYCLSEVETVFVKKCIRTIGLLAIKLINFAGTAVQTLVDLVRRVSGIDEAGGAQGGSGEKGRSQAGAQAGAQSSGMTELLGDPIADPQAEQGASGAEAAEAPAPQAAQGITVQASADSKSLTTGYAAVVQESLIAIRDIIRCYPGYFDGAIVPMLQAVSSVDDVEARCALFFIIGENAEIIENVVDLLEDFAEGFSDEAEPAQLTLLTACVKAFLTSPNTETQKLVQAVLTQATSIGKGEDQARRSDRADVVTDSETASFNICSPDVRERGFFYWRLLSAGSENNFELAKRVVFAAKGDDQRIGLDRAKAVEIVDAGLARTVFVPNLGCFSAISRLDVESLKFASSALYTTSGKANRAQRQSALQSAFGNYNDDADDILNLYAPTAAEGEAEALDDLLGAEEPEDNTAAVVGAVKTIEDDSAQKISDLLRSTQTAPTASQQLAENVYNATYSMGTSYTHYDVPYIEVLPSESGSGLAVDACFQSDASGAAGGSMLFLRLRNTNLEFSVNDFMIQLNSNERGLQQSNYLIDIGLLGPGATYEVQVPCHADVNCVDTDVSPGYVQMALKSNLGIFYFAVALD